MAFGCHDGILRFVSALLGRVLWSIDLGGVIFASPTVVATGSEALVACVATTCGELFVLALPAVYDHDDEEEAGCDDIKGYKGSRSSHASVEILD